ncbi:hypothetical protein [Amnibacterium kyonggiense]
MTVERVPADGASLTAVSDHDVWRTGTLITGVVHVINTSTEARLRFGTGVPAIGKLSTLAGVPVGDDRRPHRGTGRRIDLAPGAGTTVPFTCSSSSLDSELGTTLPPGDYHLVVHLRASTDRAHRWVTAAPITVRLE